MLHSRQIHVVFVSKCVSFQWRMRWAKWHIHGIFDRSHGKCIEKFKGVEKLEPADHGSFIEGFNMSPQAIMESYNSCQRCFIIRDAGGN